MIPNSSQFREISQAIGVLVPLRLHEFTTTLSSFFFIFFWYLGQVFSIPSLPTSYPRVLCGMRTVSSPGDSRNCHGE